MTRSSGELMLQLHTPNSCHLETNSWSQEHRYFCVRFLKHHSGTVFISPIETWRQFEVVFTSAHLSKVGRSNFSAVSDT